MFYHLKIIIRNIQKNGLYSVINIAGLAISLTACIFIMLWVWDELSFDRFHRNVANIYSLSQKNGNYYSNTSLEAITPAAAAEIPEIVKTCRVNAYYKDFWEYDNNKFFSLNGAAVDTSFFNMFNFKIVKGNTRNPFIDHSSMIISETLAGILFGNDDPIGKSVKSHDNKQFHIIGVMKDMPENTRFRYDYLVPFIAMQLDMQRADISTVVDENWKGFFVETYFQLIPRVDAALVADKIGKMVAYRMENMETRNMEATFILQPLLKMHLFTPEGLPQGMQIVRLFGVIAVMILLIACINYVNLITARASKRNKEISIKKIHGGKRIQLMAQLTGETVLLYIVALTFSTLFVYLLFPLYNQIAGKEMEFSLLNSSVLWVYGITTVSVILLAGLYPAIHLSSFKPLDAFRGSVSGRSKHGYLRKTLIVVQFVFSFGLIIAMIVIGSQLNYMRNKDLGYNKENVFTFNARGMYSHYETVKNELMKNPNIIGVSGALWGQSLVRNLHWEGKSNDESSQIFVQQMICYDFLQLMNMQLTNGEYLSEHDDKYILVNEEAIKAMGMDNPTGKQIRATLRRGIEEEFTIKGVVKDYHFRTLKEPIRPLILTMGEYPFSLYVKTVEGGAKSALASVELLWKEYNPDIEFRYSFLEDEFELMYKADLRVGKLLYTFAFIAIFVSCLGMFGLVTFMAESKTKEIGIRKVLGANIGNIVSMLSKEFLILVGIAILIAFPLAYYWADKFLQDFAYRINIGWWMFTLAGIITIVLTLLTVGWQALKAATENPVKAIKSE